MDNIEEVKEILKDLVESIDCSNDIFAYESFYHLAAQQICRLFKLPEGEPPLLSEGQRDEVIERFYQGVKRYICSEDHFDEEIAKVIAQAQRDSDIKWMRGE